ncbi:MAG TPA: hypothetical protein VF817_00635 [Patescibacteria group bacterium]
MQLAECPRQKDKGPKKKNCRKNDDRQDKRKKEAFGCEFVFDYFSKNKGRNCCQ